jgi:hypothetical protein
MIEVFNLASDDQVSFMPVMGTLWAVVLVILPPPLLNYLEEKEPWS